MKKNIKNFAIQNLNCMAFAAAIQAHPEMPPKYLAPRRYNDRTANGLTKCIIDFLRLKGWQVERINTIGVPIDRRKVVTDVLGHIKQIGSICWRKGNITKGSADISATIAGKSLKIEVKIEKDRQSAAQKKYQKDVEALGGIYFVASTFENFYKWYNKNM